MNDLIYNPYKYPGKLVGYHFQNPDFQLFSTTVEEEITAGPYAAGIPKQEIIKRKNALLSAFGLSNLTHLHPFELPSVLRKRLAICATLAMGCPFYVFDEPTIWQDKKSAEAIIQILKQISSLGVGIIIISHSEWIKKQFAATNLYLEDGIIKN